MTDVAITELTDLAAEKVSGVDSPANGTPWLLLKSSAKTIVGDDESGEEDEQQPAAKGASKPKRARKSPAEKSAGVPDNATHVSVDMEGGRVTATGQSGQRMAPMVTGTRAPDAVCAPGGETPSVGGAHTQVIPNEAKVTTPEATVLMAAKVAYVVTSLAEAAERIAAQRNLPNVAEGLRKAIDAMQEGAEGDDLLLTKETETALIAARDHLSQILGGTNPAGHAGASASKEDGTMSLEVTKTELDELVAKAATEAVAADRVASAKRVKKAAKKAAKLARKNANNGGDITAGEIRGGVNGTTDSDDLNVIGNGPDLSKADAQDEDDVRKQLKEVKALLQKMAARPRPGGPNLTGVIPAMEGRHGEEAVKSTEDTVIENLRKELADAQKEKGPEAMQRASNLSYQLTHAQLRAGHRAGEI